MQSSERFDPEPSNARLVRDFVRTTLQQWNVSALEWPVTESVSELATNVILHAKTPFTVELSLLGDVLTAQVIDGSSRGAALRSATAQATTGRGLLLVSELAQTWGVEVQERGKSVWCTFAINPSDRSDDGSIGTVMNDPRNRSNISGPGSTEGFTSSACAL